MAENDGYLEWGYNIEPDEHGVFDGHRLARQLIIDAYRLLMPYVNACPACSDALFTVTANEAIAQIHEDEVTGYVMAAGASAEQKAAHFEEAKARTKELLARAGEFAPHDHE
jgi:hypothetical protein